MLGIEWDKNLYYEGSGQVGFGIWPSPLVTVATVFSKESDLGQVPTGTDLGVARLLFREDSYDPITRVRRGRFYNRDDGAQPQGWSTQPHPAYAEEVGYRREPNGFLSKRLYGFHNWPARQHLGRSNPRASIVLGIRDAMTIWRVVGVEQISTGEDLVTLKARGNLGVLPEIDSFVVPEGERARVVQCLEKLVDTAYRAGPESVVDRSRDLAAAALGAHFEGKTPGHSSLDLGVLGKLAEGEQKYLLANGAKILSILHSRAKPSEQARRGVRVPDEDDADLAISLASMILRELGWAN